MELAAENCHPQRRNFRLAYQRRKYQTEAKRLNAAAEALKVATAKETLARFPLVRHLPRCLAHSLAVGVALGRSHNPSSDSTAAHALGPA